MKEQKIFIDSGDYESVPIDNLAIGDVGVVVSSPYKDGFDKDGRRIEEEDRPDTYAGKPFVLGAKEIVFFEGIYCEVNNIGDWTFRKLRPGEKVIITGT